jgi:hypothetical protein
MGLRTSETWHSPPRERSDATINTSNNQENNQTPRSHLCGSGEILTTRKDSILISG